MIIGSICARAGSKGVPRKNLRRLGGITLLERAIECAKACDLLDRVVVSTEDDEIASVARAAGAEVPFVRPADLAADDSPKWAVFRHLVTALEATGPAVDILADLDAGVPLRTPADVTDSIQRLRQSGADVVITAYEADRNPYFNMVETDPNGWARLVKPLDRLVTRRQSAPHVFSLSPSVFAIRRSALERYAHWSESRMQVHEIPRYRAHDIDSELDLQIAEFFLDKLKYVHT
jgi:CMP-N,N'-diacetyllegionaminic acid synthase